MNNVEKDKLELRSPTKPVKPPSRRWLLWLGVVLVELLLMGSAFVGGRMLAQQNVRNNRSQGFQLPAQLPKDPAAGSGSVQKIQDTVITLTRGRGGAPGTSGSSTSNQTEVAVTAETKYYKNTSSQQGFQGPQGGQAQVQVQDATLTDVKVGNYIMVWGAKNGERITAEVIYIQSAGR